MTQMTYLQDKINTFLILQPQIYKKALEKIINVMLNKCKYINGESLERHNWGKSPIKLKYIPTNKDSLSFEEDLLNAIDLDDNEKSILELLWGDIQLGKRVHACIIMWFSIHILNRPVLYIFRNLIVDQKQLQADIEGTENYNFNIQFIKNLFEEFNKDLEEYCNGSNVDHWKKFKLPPLQLISMNSNDIINKFSSKESIKNEREVFCCLMNPSQLAKINTKFSEYISKNNELVDITVLVDESDLMCSTASNDRTDAKDKQDSTACEILLAKIYKKVKYTLHITGTAHSLLYNVTTRLTDHTYIQNKISKVHKMKRSNDYYGLFNDSIHFNTKLVKPWWDYQDTENHKKKVCYDIVKDYEINIKRIIKEIQKRPANKYNSLLISEEKIKVKQFCLVDKIIKDFSDLFIVIYHGNCLRLYLSKKYEQTINHCSQWDSKQSPIQRLWQFGGVYGDGLDTEKSEKLPNNYCYFNIDTKLFNIKFVYKLLRILFEKSDIPIVSKTVVTITGKYGERGYSFTSDDYDKYTFHLTDQYYVSHASFNSTNGSQEVRLQQLSSDVELKNGTMELTLWTTPLFKDIMVNFYVKFIKEIEKFIMDCENWEEIKDLLENKIFDNGDLKFGKYMKYIDVRKKRKSLKIMKHFDKKMNGYSLIGIDDMVDSEIEEWCKENNFPPYICVNEIEEINSSEFRFNKINKPGIPIKIKLPNVTSLSADKLTKVNKNKFISDISQFLPTGFSEKNLVNKRMVGEYDPKYEVLAIKKCIDENKPKRPDKNCKKSDDYNLLIITNDIPEFNCERGDCFITFYTNEYETINKQLDVTNPFKNDNIFTTYGDKVKYSVIKSEYKQLNLHGYKNEDNDDFIEDDGGLPNKYYWKTPDGWLYYYDKDKPKVMSLNIVTPLPIKNVIQTNISIEPLINSDILLFANSCCKKPDKTNLRLGLKDIFNIYETWCKINGKKHLTTQKKFKEEFEKLNYKEEKSKGVDVNNTPGKRGYNVMVSL